MTKRGRPRGPRPDVAAILAARATGATWEEVGQQLGVKRQTVLRVLGEAGLKAAEVPAGDRSAASAAPVVVPSPPPNPSKVPVPEHLRPLQDIVDNPKASPTQKLKAQHLILQYTHGKPSAATSAGGRFRAPAVAGESAAFAVSQLPTDVAARYLEHLRAIKEIEDQYRIGIEDDDAP